jgi:hypothetical protein
VAEPAPGGVAAIKEVHDEEPSNGSLQNADHRKK